MIPKRSLFLVPFLKDKILRLPIETARVSEAVLGRDWLLPEEDRAWRDL
jgi:hypothetical protein